MCAVALNPLQRKLPSGASHLVHLFLFVTKQLSMTTTVSSFALAFDSSSERMVSFGKSLC